MKKLKSLSIVLLSFAVFSTVLFTAGNQAQAASKPQMITKGPSIQSLTPVIKAEIPWGNGVANAKTVIKFLKSKGFKVVSQKGSHVKLKGLNGKTTIVPSHGSKDIPKGTLKSILQQAGIKKK
ncbi:hypothetical protein CHI12_06810 [Terribacillus saccharophilus]|uniref:Type II toxin-antitoxin system HicA family toxin n=1 Tax=Terribacillus saccharophilus TaxID=361277 RepID=A0A268HEJ5_9BACI|nr:type II toxin-antitoxin system HicA family toxin [Terribacillus saccharophilus]PAE08299.1 hypothetical protein CHI12_06810 [Terribacillus saccharophilus]